MAQLFTILKVGKLSEAALKVLMDEKFGWKPIIKEAIQAAHVKSRKLASD